MTEDEWNRCTDPEKLLKWLRREGKLSERKLRLFAVACCRRVWPLLTDERSRRAVDVAERYADGRASEVDRATAEGDAFTVNLAGYQGELEWYYDGYEPGRPTQAYLAGEAAVGALCSRAECAAAFASGRALEATGGDERTAQASLFRDIFGPPPSRLVALRPESLAPAILALAQRAYDDRLLPEGHLAPAHLVALAGALEAAGCTDAQLLAHLRSPGTHVRGCFALDAVLGKS